MNLFENCLLGISIAIPFLYLYPNIIYNAGLEANFYYRKLLKYMEHTDDNIKDITETDLENENLKIISYSYNGEKYINLSTLETPINFNNVIVDKEEYESVRNTMTCPNSRESFLMATLEIKEKDSIDIVEDIREIAGPYLKNLSNNEEYKGLLWKYLKHKYPADLNNYDKNNIKLSDGTEYEFPYGQ